MVLNIPIDYNCDVTSHLRYHKIREHAYPFDWNISNLGTILNLIKSKGDGFLLDENVRIGKVEFSQTYDNIPDKVFMSRNVFDKGTGILICHDYPSEGIAFSKIREKYKKRFDKLEDHLQNATEVNLWTTSSKHYKGFKCLKNFKQYDELVDRMGFDFNEQCPPDVSIEQVADYILKEYTIKKIHIKVKL